MGSMMVGPTLADVPDLWRADSRESGSPDLSGDISQLCFSETNATSGTAQSASSSGSPGPSEWVRAEPFHGFAQCPSMGSRNTPDPAPEEPAGYS